MTSKPVDADFSKATPIEPGEPTVADAVTQQGSTFAARAAAAKKAAAKSVKADDAEDKAVKSSSTKSRTSRK